MLADGDGHDRAAVEPEVHARRVCRPEARLEPFDESAIDQRLVEQVDDIGSEEGPEEDVDVHRGACRYHLSTRIARSVFHRLGLPSPSSIAKCSRPGCGFSRGQRPSESRFDSRRSIASATRSYGEVRTEPWRSGPRSTS